MARPIYSHELADPDFAWLVSSFQENNPGYVLVETVCVPLVFLKQEKILPEHDMPPVSVDADEIDPDL